MNEQQFDKLFQKKLVDYSQMPSEEALKKLDSRINRRHRGVVIQFSKVAATLLILAVSIYLIGNRNQQTEEKVAVISKEDISNSTTPTPMAADSVKTGTKSDITTPRKLDPKPSGSTLISNNEVKPDPGSPEKSPAGEFNEKTNAMENSLAVDLPVKIKQPDQTATLKQEPVRQKVTITYKRSLASPNPELASNEQDQRKNKILKGFWKTAVQVDQNISLAGIRATKDELLAINRRGKIKETKPD
jgi:hypothetical protein